MASCKRPRARCSVSSLVFMYFSDCNQKVYYCDNTGKIYQTVKPGKFSASAAGPTCQAAADAWPHVMNGGRNGSKVVL